ncbi:MAG: hypothetical protein RLZ98_1909 [Pseudomonadota bacterium]|jgi:hypothetical protein
MFAVDVQAVSAEMLETHQRLKSAGTPGSALARVGQLVGRMGRRLARPPRLLLLGEFNSGKTTLANALLGARVLPTSLLSNTSVPILAKFGEQASLYARASDGSRQPVVWDGLGEFDFAHTQMLQVELPIEQLRRFEVIDTPGLETGAAVLDGRSRRATSAAHIAVWCTPATQAWKASELKMWLSLPARMRAGAILAVTYKDALADPLAQSRIEARLKAEAGPHFSRIVFLSARKAYRARINEAQVADAAKWQASGGEALQAAIDAALTVEAAHRVKMAQRVLRNAMQQAGIAGRG